MGKYIFIRICDDITSIKRLKENYPKIEENIFNELLKVDPTYNGNANEAGKYTNWILSLFNQNNLKQEDFYKVKGCLEKFMKYKTKISNRDINSYRTLPDLVKAIEEAEAKSPTKSEIKRNVERTDLDKEAELYMETENFDIYIPLTYEASCKLGSNTEWCTATRETRDHYDDYTNGGDLYIMINKNDKSEKYQYNDKENYTCDRYDEQISASGLCFKYNDLVKFYKKFDNNIEDKIEEIKELQSKPFVYNGKRIDYDIRPYIKNITISNNVTEIGKKAFSECKSLQAITIPNGVTKICDFAFAYCKSLQSITIPNSVTFIGDYAFAECESLQSITIPNGVTELGGHAFLYCKSLQSITIPNGVTEIGGHSFRDCEALQSITIPNGVTKICDFAFSDCESLQSITIPNSVTEIGKRAFDNCENLTIYTSIPKEKFESFEGYNKNLKIVYTNGGN